MTLRTIGDKIVVFLDKEEEVTTEGGIIIPESVTNRPIAGTVLATGAGEYDNKGNLIPMTIDEGKRVFCTRYSGTTIKYNNDEYLVVRERDILAIIDDR